MPEFKKVFQNDILVVERTEPDQYYAVEVTISNANDIASYISEKYKCHSIKVVLKKTKVLPVVPITPLDVNYWPITISIGTYLVKIDQQLILCSEDFFLKTYQPSFSNLIYYQS